MDKVHAEGNTGTGVKIGMCVFGHYISMTVIINSSFLKLASILVLTTTILLLDQTALDLARRSLPVTILRGAR